MAAADCTRACRKCGVALGGPTGRRGRPRLDCEKCAETVRIAGRVVRNKARSTRPWTTRDALAKELGLGAQPECVVCGRASMARGLCSTHYLRFQTKSALTNRCKWCGAEHDGRGLCSKGCKSASTRATRSYQNARRRRAMDGGDRIDPISVFERDKWRCHMCGGKTLKSMRGKIDPRAPELDHIITIAEGGAHTWGNVACSCRRCNGAKQANSRGQLGLGFAA